MRTKSSRYKLAVAGAAFIGLLSLAAFSSGCGDTATSDTKSGTTSTAVATTPTSTVPEWPNVPVTKETVKGVITRTLGAAITPKIPVVRDIGVTETTPGRFKISASYNQPGMCHSDGGTANWHVSILQQYASMLLKVYYKNAQIDTVTLDAYATEDPTIDDPAQFERVSHLVIERSRVQGYDWEAPRASANLPSLSTEYWMTPKASQS